MTEKNTIGVYIMTDADGNVTNINSSVFLADTEGWTWIDEGNGDKYAHAQSHYLSKPLIDEYGRYNFTLKNKKIKEIKEKDKPAITEPPKTETSADLAARITAIENDMQSFKATVLSELQKLADSI
ncbi:MAG: hypothetical protein IJ416_05915 [Ruminiclostridium sp.]|nr:hypothetical protein [Ruminiclostridium sp.]